MFSFSLGKTQVSADIGFLAVIALISLSGRNMCGYSFAACIIHESGHLLCILAVHDRIQSISFNAAGIKIVQSRKRMHSFSDDIAVLLSGPAANILTGFAVIFFCPESNISFSVINIILGVFNLFPFSVLDGGSILRLISESRMNNGKCIYTLKIINMAVCTAAVVLWFLYDRKNITVPVICIYLFISELKSEGID